MPRPSAGKTETIKKRTIYVYLPSEEMVEEWKRIAKERGVSLSKFVIECVQKALEEREEPDLPSSEELLKEYHELKREHAELMREREKLRTLVERLEEELRIYRTKPPYELFSGEKGIQQELVQLFKSRKRIGYGEIYDLLDLNPSKDSDLVKKYLKHIELLEDLGLIESTPRGWKWVL